MYRLQPRLNNEWLSFIRYKTNSLHFPPCLKPFMISTQLSPQLFLHLFALLLSTFIETIFVTQLIVCLRHYLIHGTSSFLFLISYKANAHEWFSKWLEMHLERHSTQHSSPFHNTFFNLFPYYIFFFLDRLLTNTMRRNGNLCDTRAVYVAEMRLDRRTCDRIVLLGVMSWRKRKSSLTFQRLRGYVRIDKKLAIVSWRVCRNFSNGRLDALFNNKLWSTRMAMKVATL